MVQSEGNMSLKNPVTPPGFDPGTVRLVAQRLNHYATPVVMTVSNSSILLLVANGHNCIKCTTDVVREKVPGPSD